MLTFKDTKTVVNFKRQLKNLRGADESNTIPDAPELKPYLDDILSAFFDLSSTRSIGFGVGVIPYNYIKDYADSFYDDYNWHYFFMQTIRAMDNLYIEIKSNELKANKTGANTRRSS